MSFSSRALIIENVNEDIWSTNQGKQKKYSVLKTNSHKNKWWNKWEVIIRKLKQLPDLPAISFLVWSNIVISAHITGRRRSSFLQSETTRARVAWFRHRLKCSRLEIKVGICPATVSLFFFFFCQVVLAVLCVSYRSYFGTWPSAAASL